MKNPDNTLLKERRAELHDSESVGVSETGAVALWRRYTHQLRGYIRRKMHGSGETEDLLQDVFVELLRTDPAPEHVQKPLSYVLSITHRVIARHVHAEQQRRARFTAVGEEDLERVEAQVSSELCESFEGVIGVEHDIMAAMDELPPLYKACLVLRVREDLSYRDIARELAIQPDTVRKYLRLARQHLRNRYWREVEDTSHE